MTVVRIVLNEYFVLSVTYDIHRSQMLSLSSNLKDNPPLYALSTCKRHLIQ